MPMQLIDYGAGNLRSVAAALARLGVPYRIVADGDACDPTGPVILPGVGAAGSAMRAMRESGLIQALANVHRPILGICLGMQLFGTDSEENATSTLGFLAGRTRRLVGAPKIPHIGWNRVTRVGASPLFKDIPDGAYFYFAHSYTLEVPADTVTAWTTYGPQFPAAVGSERLYGVQFHPEKSGDVGMQLLRNFCEVAA